MYCGNANFLKDEGGAVTVDWVVLTAAIVGLGLVVMATVGGGIKTTASSVASSISSTVASAASSASAATTAFNGKKATDYVAYGQSLAPGNNGAVYGHATSAASADAPAGYNFSNPLYEASSGNVVYTSTDGANYSIGGNVVSKASYTGTVSYFGA